MLPTLPALVPSFLCLFIWGFVQRSFFFSFPLLYFLFFSFLLYFSTQRSFLSTSAQVLLLGEKRENMDTVLLLLLSTSTFPLLASPSSHFPFIPKSVKLPDPFKSPSTTRWLPHLWWSTWPSTVHHSMPEHGMWGDSALSQLLDSCLGYSGKWLKAYLFLLWLATLIGCSEAWQFSCVSQFSWAPSIWAMSDSLYLNVGNVVLLKLISVWML